MGHRRGEEADALAALSRALREGTLQPKVEAIAAKIPSATPAAAPVAAAPAAAAVPQPEERSKPKKEKKKEKKKKEVKEKKKEKKMANKRKHEEQPAKPDAGGDGGAAVPESAGSGELTAIHVLLERLEKVAGALQSAATATRDGADHALLQHLAALAACAAQLCDALAAAGAADPPAALTLLRVQAKQLHAAAACLPMRPAFLPEHQLAALSLQAQAAAAGVRQLVANSSAGTGVLLQQAAAGAASGGSAPLDAREQQRWRQWYLPTFADCFAAEVEALQESEPPIPAGVLLQCVGLAADSTALFPPALKRLVLADGCGGHDSSA